MTSPWITADWAGRARTARPGTGLGDRLGRYLPPVWLTRVESGSMTPTLRPGQLAVTRRLGPADVVRRGDLVVLDTGGVLQAEGVPRTMVKRVVGLPGERVDFRAGQVVIDGVPLDEPYAAPSVYTATFDVPPGQYLVAGDARDRSSDSRVWSQPYIPRRQLQGRICRLPRPVLRLLRRSRRRTTV